MSQVALRPQFLNFAELRRDKAKIGCYTSLNPICLSFRHNSPHFPTPNCYAWREGFRTGAGLVDVETRPQRISQERRRAMMFRHGLLAWLRSDACFGTLLSRSSAQRRPERKARATSPELLEPRQLLATFGVNSTKVASAQDYFAVEQNNVIDYSEAQSNIGGVDDRQNAGLDDDNLVNPTVSGGSYNFTTTASSQIFLLHPGLVDGENNPLNRAIGVVPEDTTGETIPIDTSKYYILNLKITAPSNIPNVELVGGAAYQGNVQWDNGGRSPQHRDPAVLPVSRDEHLQLQSENDLARTKRVGGLDREHLRAAIVSQQHRQRPPEHRLGHTDGRKPGVRSRVGLGCER